MTELVTEKVINGAKLSLIQGNIIRQATDAIVNAANSSLMGGGGVDGAIHRAGGPAILAECRQIVARQGQLPAGKAVITNGGNLKSMFVIHTVGPVWHDGKQGEAEILAGAYQESLNTAAAHNLTSISFPSISTGAYRYPVDEAAEIALKTVASFLIKHPGSIKEVAFVLFDSAILAVYQSALARL